VLIRFLASLILHTSRRRGLVLSLTGLVLAASVVAATRLSFDSDVISLLPRQGDAIPAFRDYLQRFGSLDHLYVVFTAPEGHAVADYADEIDGWVEELRAAPEIARVDAGLLDASRDWQYVADRELLLLPDAALDAALMRLEPEGLRSALTASRELLAVPSPEVAATVQNDPLGLLPLLGESLGGANAGFNLGATDGYITPDGRRRLVMARPAHPPYDTTFSQALLARLETIAASRRATRDAEQAGEDEIDARPPLEVAFAGGHRIAVETEAVVRRESIWNSVGSLALILPLLYVVFRSPWLVACGALPSIVSLAIVLGALGLAGATLSAAATGAAAMLFGLGVDGVVLLYVSHRLALADGATGEDAVAGLAGPAESMLLGMWTTAATFYGLMVVDFPSLEQLGRLIGHSMVVCGLLTLVLVPALLSRRTPQRRPRKLIMPSLASFVGRHRTSVLAITALITLALGFAARDLRVNPTLERLRSTTPGAVFEEEVARMFGLPSEVYVVLADDTDLDRALEQNERLRTAVATQMPSMPVQAPSALVPSRARQAAVRTRLAALGRSPTDIASDLAAAARSAGFKPDVFAPFISRLPRLLMPSDDLTYDGYASHGLDDLVGRMVSAGEGRWTLATYVFPRTADEATQLAAVVRETGSSQRLTGLPLVNAELARSFLPQFLRGLLAGSAIVVVLILLAFRNLRLTVLALVPTVIGLCWAAGLLSLFGVELDLFAVFAVITFVGVGVDYGVHLVNRVREHGDAVRGVSELAPVILVAGAITLLGYGTLMTSSYPPLRSMGTVSIISIISIVSASLLVLPALLISNGASQRKVMD
jgi:predicted RND superfamily exporter protein